MTIHLIKLDHGFVYLTAMINWYSRCIVGWELDDTLDTSRVIKALNEAFAVAKPVILNSDQGCQFTSIGYYYEAASPCDETKLEQEISSIFYDNRDECSTLF
ncbi:DDE-type integrase/transposase/recombinase [Anaerotignum propionicum]|uniref:DDE-type integrase/transposase/recombinase n=1 Tax=Anaerotignum propionicum TaxID=28446 RepID=UPI00289A81E9|nr:DDE-type integrase/transposase/recombinase [Anaerotignum propionicum]